jgi:hypothetical protein
MRPPPLATQIVAGLVPERGYRDAILGDLEEEFGEVCGRSGASTARGWYWSQTLSSIVPLARARPWSLATASRLLATVAVTYLLTIEGIRAEAVLLIPMHASLPVRLVLLFCVALAGVAAGWITIKALPREPVIGGLFLVGITLGAGIYNISSGTEAQATFRGMIVVTLMCSMCFGSLVGLRQHSRI